MGTNYYLHTDFCPRCGTAKTEIHLGKSSMGRKFLFHKHSFMKSIEQVKEVVKLGVIYNEYGEKLSSVDFFDFVESKQNESPHPKEDMGVEVIDGYDFLERDFR